MSQPAAHSATETGQSNAQKHIVLLDTDIGDDIDDALALALVLHSPEIELLGVTTVFGDTTLRARLASHLLQVFGRNDIPVAAGIEQPLLLRHRPSGVHQAEVLSGCKDTPQVDTISGPDLIIKTALAHHGQLTLICIGPLTNVATALRKEPRLFMAVRRIVMMGGTSGFPWPEWNVRSDARAAQVVLSAGIPVTLLGWNVTTRCQLSEKDIERLRSHGSPQTQLLCDLIAVWQRGRARLPYLHDPLTLVALCAPELLEFKEITVRVPNRGPLKGFMIPHVMNGPLVHAAKRVNAGAAKEWIMERLLQGT